MTEKWNEKLLKNANCEQPYYYAAHLCPHGTNNDHPDFDFRNSAQLVNPHGDYDENLAKFLASSNQAEYKQN